MRSSLPVSPWGVSQVTPLVTFVLGHDVGSGVEPHCT